MDKNELICIVDMFSMNQKIVYPENEEIVIPTDMIVNYLVNSYYHDTNVEKIHFFGNEAYINGYIDQIKTLENTKYSKNEIVIEVN